jgi:hypothetical protein
MEVSSLDKSKFSNVCPYLEKFNILSERVSSLENRRTVIMANINAVEKMASLVKEGKFNLDAKSEDAFFNNNNPETPIFEMISVKDWNSIKQALEDKGISISAKENYTVVRTTISKREKEKLLKKYSVKEGEIFIDPDLANKN